MQLETVGRMAVMILEAEVMHHSYKIIRYRKKKDEDEDETGTGESSDERDDTPCPTQPVIISTNLHTGEGSGGDVGPNESIEEEAEHGGEHGEREGNEGLEGNESDGNGGYDSDATGDSEGDSEKSNEQDSSSGRGNDETANAAKSSMFLYYVSETDRHAKDLGITLHFVGNPGISNDPSFLPPFNVLSEPAPETVILFHGSSVIPCPPHLFS